MRDTAHGESVFGFAKRWIFTPNDTDVITRIADQISSSLFGRCFDIRIVERTTDDTGEATELESETLVAQLLLAVTNVPGTGIVMTTEEDLFHFGGSEQFGPTTVTQIGGTSFHIFVPHATGLHKFHFYNARRL